MIGTYSKFCFSLVFLSRSERCDSLFFVAEVFIFIFYFFGVTGDVNEIELSQIALKSSSYVLKGRFRCLRPSC